MTIKDVARMANVSIGTVSKVINNIEKGVSQKKREEILAIIRETGYVPSAVARGMVTKHTDTIGLIIPDICNPFFPLLAKGVEECALKNNYNLFLCNTNESAKQEIKQVLMLREKQVDGIIISTCKGNDRDHVESLLDSKVPLIFVDEPAVDEKYNGVYIDNVRGGYLATEYSIRQNHRHIAYITGPRESLSSRQRLLGYINALRDYHIPFEESRTFFGSYTYENGYRYAKEILKKFPQITAILTGSDFVASGVYEAIREAGQRVPEDISVIGFDDVFTTGLFPPQLTSIAQPVYQMGSVAMEMMIRRIRGNKMLSTRYFKPELVVRRSVAFPKVEVTI